MREDQFTGRFQTSIAAGVVGSAQPPRYSVVEVSINRLSGLGMAQLDATLAAPFRDRCTQADFFAEGTRREQHVLNLDLCDFGHAHASR